MWYTNLMAKKDVIIFEKVRKKMLSECSADITTLAKVTGVSSNFPLA